MIHHCPRCTPPVPLIWQPAKLRYYCPKCFRNFTLLEVAFVKGGKA